MIEPAKNIHDTIPGKPALNPSQNRQWDPYGKAKGPIGFRLWSVHLFSPLFPNKHSQSACERHVLLNSLFDDGKQIDEAQGREPKGLGFASALIREGWALTKNGNRYISLFVPKQSPQLPVRVSALPQRRLVSGGTSPLTRASDPSKCCTRLWTHLTALYGAYGICATDAINRLTGRLVLDNGHGQVYGDLILCSPTAWYSLGTGNCGRRTIAKGMAHG